MMTETGNHLGFLRELTWNHALVILLVLVSCRLLITVMRRIVHRTARNAPSHRRLLILRAAPIVRLLIGIAAIVTIIPLLVEPNFENVIALIAAIGIALAFAVKDYVSCIIAGVVTILENTYQPGDWIEIDGTYGEVAAINLRAVHIVTADDTLVIIPHSKLWSSSVFNASGGKQSLLCVTNFYLHADHDGATIHQMLKETAEGSRYRQPDSQVKVAVSETPWGTRYKVKAYVADSREQFAMITDVTIRGKQQLRTLGVIFAQASYAAKANE
jgi:small conductance mechanosensitive channel